MQTAIAMAAMNKIAKAPPNHAELVELYKCSMASSSTSGGRLVSSSSGGNVTGSMPQKSSVIVSGIA